MSVFLCSVCSQNDAKFNEARSECNQTFPTANEVELHLINLGSLPDESDKTPMCFVHCVMEKTGMMTEEGVLVAEKFVEILKTFPNGTEVEGLDKMVEKCVEENSNQEEHCDKAYEFAKCLMSEEILQQHKDE
ncbi:hypothetical protein L9F63_010984 [Diploptera punctata]|uniref:Uncharacterized protein n=1 Tax=Diploptera punctata TaxID=6984 RepID=A0AAD8AGR5_DIPPU|nr:hypothetical protein L9F63_010984 [Diploptera punctata]